MSRGAMGRSVKMPFDIAADRWRAERDERATRLILEDGFEPEDAKREAARLMKGLALGATYEAPCTEPVQTRRAPND